MAICKRNQEVFHFRPGDLHDLPALAFRQPLWQQQILEIAMQ